MKKNLIIKFPKLNLINAGEKENLLQIFEEISEFSKVLQKTEFFTSENKHKNLLLLSDEVAERVRLDYKEMLIDGLEEIIDIAQVCVSQLFVFKNARINIELIFKESYHSDSSKNFEMFFEDNWLSVSSVPTVKDQSLFYILNLILNSLGKITSFGEIIEPSKNIIIEGQETSSEKYVLELVEIIKNCYEFLYRIGIKYNIDLEDLHEKHIESLKVKKYLTFEGDNT